MDKKTRYSVIGLGKLGACSAACIASKGFEVIGVDINEDFVEKINRGEAPVLEPQLQETLDKAKPYLRATTDYREAILNSDITLIIVPTPSAEHGGFSLKYLASAAREIGAALKEKNEFHVVDVVSTVLPGSCEQGIKPILEEASGKKCGVDFGLCYNPEFIALGTVIKNFLNPDFVLIGASDEKSGHMLGQGYKEFCDNNPPVTVMNLVNAELAKISLNTYVTTKISYSNMLANLCEQLPGADVDVVTNAIGHDTRIGKKYLQAGLGYGGPCFPRDNVALSYMAEQLGTDAEIARTTDLVNNNVITKLYNFSTRHLSEGDTIGVLGLSYKPASCVTEKSQAYMLTEKLLKEGHKVAVYDPIISEDAHLQSLGEITFMNSWKDLLNESQILVVANRDPEFNDITIADIEGAHPKAVVDCWRLFKGLKDHESINYIAFGMNSSSPRQAQGLEKTHEAVSETITHYFEELKKLA